MVSCTLQLAAPPSNDNRNGPGLVRRREVLNLERTSARHRLWDVARRREHAWRRNRVQAARPGGDNAHADGRARDLPGNRKGGKARVRPGNEGTRLAAGAEEQRLHGGVRHAERTSELV